MTSPWNLGQGLFKVNEKWQNSIDHVRLRTLSLQVDLTSCTVSELFDVEEYRYLEIWVRGHWRLLEVTPFDRSHTSFYSSSVITTVISCIVSEIQWYTVQNRDFSYPSSTQHPSGENVENIFAFFHIFILSCMSMNVTNLSNCRQLTSSSLLANENARSQSSA